MELSTLDREAVEMAFAALMTAVVTEQLCIAARIFSLPSVLFPFLFF